jgi:hypothetical protein
LFGRLLTRDLSVAEEIAQSSRHELAAVRQDRLSIGTHVVVHLIQRWIFALSDGEEIGIPAAARVAAEVHIARRKDAEAGIPFERLPQDAVRVRHLDALDAIEAGFRVKRLPPELELAEWDR